MILLRLLGISIGFFVLLFVSCKKNNEDMRIGYYSVKEIVTYENGLIDTNYFTSIGPYRSKNNKKVYSFSVKENEYVSYYSLDLEQMVSSDLDSTLSNYVYYKISSFEKSNISLTCYRVENNDSFTSNIHFKYIE